ncbi:hypothetical protein ABVK25_008598 [Lepraria finkii]|uniref:Uncharacterized protein n=1 Tax=Lepraria finkii TaxID=1340010 RepID=A0ABR4B2T0_9LECA
MYIDKTALGEGIPPGTSKQVSAEFNLLYRFHSAISRRDEGCTKKFMKEQAQLRLDCFKKTGVEEIHLEELSTFELWTMLGSFAKEKRTVERCNRDSGSYIKSNQQHFVADYSNREVTSLNEFRTFFGLEPHTTFASVNPDPEIQMALENLYDSPDMNEM